MRIAVLVIGLLLGLLLFVQTFLVYVLGSAGSDTSLAGAGAAGLLVALLWLLASAFVIGVPLLSTIVFGVAGFIALAASSGSEFSDLQIWGAASFVLAALSFVGLLTKRRGARVAERKLQERDARLAASIRESISTTNLNQIPASARFCPECGSSQSTSSRFCQDCGAPQPTASNSLPSASSS